MALSFHYSQLANGLDVVAEKNPDVHSIAIGLFVKTGARDETPRINGVSHFLEHMMFKGSEKYSALDVNRIFDEMGAIYNAYTSQEQTVYYAWVLPEFVRRAMEHLAWLLRPSLRQADFDIEKKVILEEIAMCEDDPTHVLSERLLAEYFVGHPLSMSVLGPAQSIRDLERQQMLEYFQSRYGPGNMALVVSGQFDFNEIVDLANEFCGHWPRVNAVRAYPPIQPQNKRIVLTDDKLTRQYTMGLCPGPSEQDDRRYAAGVLSSVLGSSDGSRLHWALVDKAIADNADVSYNPSDNCGHFSLSLGNDPAKTEQVVQIALAELSRVKTDINQQEIDRVKNKAASAVVLHGESPVGRMFSVGDNWINLQKYRSLQEVLASVTAVDVNAINALLQEFTFEPMTLISMGPSGGGTLPASPSD